MSLLLDVLLPTTCLYCKTLGNRVCGKCEMLVGAEPRLVSRGSLIGFSATGYDDSAKLILRAFKELGESELAAALAKPIVPLLGCFGESPNLLVPIPSNTRALRERGFNPAELLAREVAIRVSGMRWANILERTRHLADQSKLGPQARAANQKDSMNARAGSASVLLVDDVITTGSTLLEASRVLQNAGYFVTGFVTFAETESKRSILTSQAVVA